MGSGLGAGGGRPGWSWRVGRLKRLPCPAGLRSHSSTLAQQLWLCSSQLDLFFMVSPTITVTFKGVSLALCGCHVLEEA